MMKNSPLAAPFLVFLLWNGVQIQAAIIINSVETTGYASALSGAGYQSWDAMEFGGYGAQASAISTVDPGGTHTASSSASLSYEELSSTFQLSGTAAANSPTKQQSTSSSSLIVIHLTLDSSHSFSLNGSDAGGHSVGLTRLPDVAPFERYHVGDSGTVGPGNFRLQGNVSAHALLEGASESDSYSATLAFAAAPLDGDFNEDGAVNGADFLGWQRNPGVGSLSDWQTNYGAVAPLAGNSRAVPEPNSLLLLTLACAGLIQRFRSLVDQ